MNSCGIHRCLLEGRQEEAYASTDPLTGTTNRSIDQGEDRMPETGHDNTDQHATEVEQLLERIRSLEEQARKELVAKLMEGVFSAPAKMVAVAGAMKSASEEIEPELVAEAVRSTETLEGKKSAAAEAVRSIPELNDQANILGALQKEAKGVRKMLGHMIIWSIIVIAVVAALAIGMGLLGRLSTAQPLIIIDTAVASTLAGYILGASYMMGDSLRTFAREGTQEQTEE
jgi:hypothetical protein